MSKETYCLSYLRYTRQFSKEKHTKKYGAKETWYSYIYTFSTTYLNTLSDAALILSIVTRVLLFLASSGGVSSRSAASPITIVPNWVAPTNSTLASFCS